MTPHARVAVFTPDPLLSVALERRGRGDDLHIHPAGQGVWVSRMVAELGGWPVLCCLAGGETGLTLRTLLTVVPGEYRITTTAGSSGAYVVDRRAGERHVISLMARPAPQRHEIDDLVSSTCAAAVGSAVLVVCNPFPVEGIPVDVYDTIVADARANGVKVIVDLSSPRLEHTLAHGPDLVKINDWELAQYVNGPVDGPRERAAAERLLDAGARAVAITRADKPILVLPGDGDPYEIVPPVFPQGHREGCGDAMTGAVAAALARGKPLREALVLGAAAGSVNFLRHGLGTGKREAIEELAEGIEVRALNPQTAA
jgi:1-phosphofructokinase